MYRERVIKQKLNRAVLIISNVLPNSARAGILSGSHITYIRRNLLVTVDTLKVGRLLESVSLANIKSGQITLPFNHTNSVHHLVFMDGIAILGSVSVCCHYASPVEHFTVHTEESETYFAPPGYSFLDLLSRYSMKYVNVKKITAKGIHLGLNHDFLLGKKLQGTFSFVSCDVFESQDSKPLKPYTLGNAAVRFIVRRA